MRLSNNVSLVRIILRLKRCKRWGLRPARGEGADAGRVARDPERVRRRERGAVARARRPPVRRRVYHYQ